MSDDRPNIRRHTTPCKLSQGIWFHQNLNSDLRPFSSLAKLLYNNSIKQGTLPQSSNQQLSRKINFTETQTSTFLRNRPISRYDKLWTFNWKHAYFSLLKQILLVPCWRKVCSLKIQSQNQSQIWNLDKSSRSPTLLHPQNMPQYTHRWRNTPMSIAEAARVFLNLATLAASVALPLYMAMNYPLSPLFLQYQMGNWMIPLKPTKFHHLHHLQYPNKSQGITPDSSLWDLKKTP